MVRLRFKELGNDLPAYVTYEPTSFVFVGTRKSKSTSSSNADTITVATAALSGGKIELGNVTLEDHRFDNLLQNNKLESHLSPQAA